ncbi:hypothetical protein [Pontibacter flavimaris]|uniref:DUF4178 domain-containing protein n=1 Tax=Pontibacter flavimaris TaxID=1797110 RepID=A0A1Q5PHC2_9BACT|nr:hypothetical protein [Pontibacter flavimaris]OKL41591.1 hypothetical protein A3841_11160 [Pontibacter flavimaris]
MNHRKIFLLILGGILISLSSYANSCPGQKWATWSVPIVQEEIRKNEVIFLGEVLTSDGFNYSMRVIDVFKGEILSDTVYGSYKHKCYFPPLEGIWVVYSKFESTEKGLRLLGMSSLSRSLSHPLSNNIPLLPNPSEVIAARAAIKDDSVYKQVVNVMVEEVEAEEERKMLPVFLKNWMNEYAMLIAYRRGYSSRPESLPDKVQNITSYVALGLALVALVIALLKKY